MSRGHWPQCLLEALSQMGVGKVYMPRDLFVKLRLFTLWEPSPTVNDPWLPRPPPFPELEFPTEVERSNLDQKAEQQQEFRGVSPTVLALAAETA